MILTLDHVVAGYEGRDILKEVTLSIKQGSLTCIVGPNGAGKSTLLRVISGYLQPRHGTVTFNGHAISGVPPHQLLGFGIRLVESQSLFLDMTVEENVRLGGYLLNDQLTVNQRLRDIEAQFPLIRKRAGEKAGSLSGGQQRIVEFARALMLDPLLLLLDEPSVGLDPKALQQMLTAIKRVNSLGKTILMVEQNVRAGLSIATHGIMMESGRVHLQGSPQQLLAHPDLANLFFKGSADPLPLSTASSAGPTRLLSESSTPAGPTRLLSESSTPAGPTRLLSESSAIEAATLDSAYRAQEDKLLSFPIVLLSTRVGDTFSATQHEMLVLQHLLALSCGSLLLPAPLPDTHSPLELFSDDHFYQEFFDQYLWPLLNRLSTYHTGGICLTVGEETLYAALRSSEPPVLARPQMQELWKVTLERYVALLAEKVGIPLLHLGIARSGLQQWDEHDLRTMLSDLLSRSASMPALTLPTSYVALRTWVREHDQALLQQIKPTARTQPLEHGPGSKRYTREKLLARKRQMLLSQARNQ